jgi:succinate dehydrogenase/fumarate reductase flavoprotein subunit
MELDAVDTDVLIVGGGIAGCIAASRARDAGADVLIVDKVPSIRRSGDAGHGIAFLTTYLDLGEPWDTPETYARWYHDVADGLVDMSVAQRVAIDPALPSLAYLERLGVPLRDPVTAVWERVQRMWAPGPITIKFEGGDLKPILAKAALDSGARLAGGVHVTSILHDSSGRAVGATGIDIRSSQFVVFRAGAVILASGSPERQVHTPARNAYNTYHRPYHGATGFALAARAGAELANTEFLGTFLFPTGFATGAMGNLLEAGGRLVNGLGESIAERPADTGERRFGFGFVGKAAGEVINGRGPLYIDCTQLPQEKIDALMGYIGYDAPLFKEFMDQSGLDLARDPIEFDLFNSTWSGTGSPKGIVIDETCQSRVPGVFAAGDVATPSYAFGGAVCTGYVSGLTAAAFARLAGPPRLDEEHVATERARARRPLERTGVTWQSVEQGLLDTMTKYVGITRTAIGLRQADAYLREYAAAAESIAVQDAHELMRAMEVVDLALADRMMAVAALERDETRFGFLMGHYRADYPTQRDERWKGIATIVRWTDGAPDVERRIMNADPVSW